MLVPLIYRAKETLENGIIEDDASIEIVRKINYDFKKIADDLLTQKIIAVRTKLIDNIVENYIRDTPNPVIVNLGAGLTHSHLNISDKSKWYHREREKAIYLREIFCKDATGHISKSILDFSWVNEISERKDVLFIIEGVLMYLNEDDVKSVFKALSEYFEDSHIVFDTIAPEFVEEKKLKSIDKKEAPFKWGNLDSLDIQDWNFGVKKDEDYYYKLHIPMAEIAESHPLKDIDGFKVSHMRIN